MVVYHWRIRWNGRWGMTRHKWTEEHIRREHSEAIKVPESREVRLLPSTPEEIHAAIWDTPGAGIMGKPTK